MAKEIAQFSVPFGKEIVKHIHEAKRGQFRMDGPPRRKPIIPPVSVAMGKFSMEDPEADYGSFSSFGDEPYFLSASPVEVGYLEGTTWHGSGRWVTVHHPNNYGVHLENTYCTMMEVGGQWQTGDAGLSMIRTTTQDGETFTLRGVDIMFQGDVDMDGVSEGGAMSIWLAWEQDDWHVVSQRCEEVE